MTCDCGCEDEMTCDCGCEDEREDEGVRVMCRYHWEDMKMDSQREDEE